MLEEIQFFIKRALFGGSGSIFCFHRVGYSSERPCLLGSRYMWISQDKLDEILSYIKKNLGFSFISLHEHLENVVSAKKRRAVSITFDDGYRDNISVALPVLEKHDAPATIFVTTGLVDQVTPMWWVALEMFAAEDRSHSISFEDMRRLCISSGVDAVTSVFEQAGLAPDWSALSREHIMSWEDIRRHIAHPLITFGAHTISHPSLASLTVAEAQHEMVASRERLREQTGLEPTVLAYPFGSPGECGVREFDLAREVGFRAAVTTQPGNLYPSHREKMFSLPRTCLSEPQISFPLLANKLSGYDDFRHGRRRGDAGCRFGLSVDNVRHY